MPPHPKIAAEKLLRTMLPEELAISLSAIGECDLQAKKYLYTLRKEKKTLCKQGEAVFSCCIGLADTATPDTDRIVAEYLLLTNDEERYLKTANLSQISGPRSPATTPVGVWDQNINGRIEALRMAPARMDVLYGFGTMRPDMPVRIERRPAADPWQMFSAECLRLLSQIPPFNRPFPNIHPAEAITNANGMTRMAVEVEMHSMLATGEVLQYGPDYIRDRFLRQSVRDLALRAEGFMIYGMYEMETVRHADRCARSTDLDGGRSLRLMSLYDIARNDRRVVLSAGLFIHR